MPTRFPALVMLLCAIQAVGAPDESDRAVARPVPPDWTVTVGGGAIAVPSYPGAASSRLMPVPFVDVRYRDLLFLSPIMGVGVNAITTARFQLGVSVLPDFGRSASAGDRLRGWGDLGPGANLKVFATYSLGPVALVADVRRQLGAGNGILVDAGLTKMLPLARHLILGSTATLTWADARYARAYFGVDGDQSAIALAQGNPLRLYSPGAGLHDAALTLVAIVPFDERWSMQSIVRAEVLLGDAAASPLTEQRIQPTFGGFVAYRL